MKHVKNAVLSVIVGLFMGVVIGIFFNISYTPYWKIIALVAGCFTAFGFWIGREWETF